MLESTVLQLPVCGLGADVVALDAADVSSVDCSAASVLGFSVSKCSQSLMRVPTNLYIAV